MISIVCDAFGCTPLEAEQQPWSLVQAILDYRAAKTVMDLTEQGEGGAKVLAKYPSLLQGLEQVRMAQYEHVYYQEGAPFGPTRAGFERWLKMQSTSTEGGA